MKTVTVPTWKSILYNVVSFIFSPFTKTQKKVYVLDDTREEVEVPFEETTMTSTFSEIREQIAGLQKVKVEKLDDFEKLDVFYQQVNQLSERITFIGTSLYDSTFPNVRISKGISFRTAFSASTGTTGKVCLITSFLSQPV